MEKGTNFFDSKTLLAIILTLGVLFGWQTYLAKKYPPTPKTQEQLDGAPVERASDKITQKQEQKNENTTAVKEGSPSTDLKKASHKETLTTIKLKNFSLELSSIGMGLRNILLNDYTDRENKNIVLAQETGTYTLFETILAGTESERIEFDIQKLNENQFQGKNSSGTYEIFKKLTFDSETYSVVVETTYANLPYDLTIMLPEKIVKGAESSFFAPAMDHQTIYVQHGGTSDRIIVDHNKKFDAADVQEYLLEEKNKTYVNSSVVAAGSLYFTSALLDQSPLAPEVKIQTAFQEGAGSFHFDKVFSYLTYKSNPTSKPVQIKQQVYFGPKDIQKLTVVNENLGSIVDFGMFSWLVKPMLSMLRWLYSFVGNYGAVIILMTLFIRILLFPLMISSQRSMKKIQLIQPAMQKLKEKFKDNPQQMQIEMMNLYKVHGVNPLGGCLPMLAQLPIFIGFYSMLGHSIELYKAPFILWIQDLSAKDPYYIFPLLMGVAMFFQQKMTPNTAMDPAQQKILQWMPVIFMFFMLSLPSGLTLYMLVSSLFGIGQQYYFLKDNKKQQTALNAVIAKE